MMRMGIAALWRLVVLMAVSTQGDGPPEWAYPVRPADYQQAPEDGAVRKVHGSALSYTVAQTNDPFLALDWHPEDHPPLPEVVAHGRRPGIFACGYCHRADGPGGPENTDIAGLPYAYILQQLADYKNGTRSTALPQRAPQAKMILSAEALNEEDAREAANYFSSLKRRGNIRVVETARVPKTYLGSWIVATRKAEGTEPLGERIVDTPENLAEFESRDSHAKFVAYVPLGSLRKGAALVSGKLPAKAPACEACHGKTLKGLDAVPSISGRSPSYVFRQLYEFKSGARNGKNAVQMRAVVANLTSGDMLAIAAYLASRKP